MTQIIDMFAHIRGPKYTDALARLEGVVSLMPDPIRDTMEGRFASIEEQCSGIGYTSVLSTMQENIKSVSHEIALCQICNDEYCELVDRYPYFIGAAALLPTSDMKAAVREAERAVTQLKLSGFLVGSHVQGDLLGHEKMFELYDLAVEYDVPIWIHPFNRYHNVDFSPLDYACETTKTMMDLTTCGVFERHPDIKFIVHHGGGVTAIMYPRIIAMYYNRKHMGGPMPGETVTAPFPSAAPEPSGYVYTPEQSRMYFENLKKFYFDTAFDGVAANALALRIKFFGLDRAVFSGDFPGGPTSATCLKDSIDMIEELPVGDEDKRKIYSDNAKKLLKLPG